MTEFLKYDPSEVLRLENYNTREEWFEAFKEYTCKLDPMDAILAISHNVEETA